MKLAVTELKDAIRFFQEHAGYSVPPGRMACARNMAQAEADARLLGFTFEWSEDEERCNGCECGSKDCKCFTGEPHETLCCVCRDNKGEVKASLCGICEPDAAYRRVIEAELAMEAL